MITAYGSVEAAVDALKLGANDYFSKPWDNEKLIIEIDRMIARRLLEYENTHLKRALKQRYSFPNIIGKSERMVRMLDLVAQVAPSRSTILITGETGTGKELVAKAIHANSPRADQMFVAVNSGSLPPDLLESTLFGHVKGAFTSAIQTKKGYFEVADRGHHFLRRDRHHRAGDADQAAARDPGEGVHAAGLHRPVNAWTCASWPPPTPIWRKLVKEGKFREDLYYRLNVINIALPPLRDRKEDIPPLVEPLLHQLLPENEKFLDSAGKIHAAIRAGGHAGADGAQLARQRARTGKRGGARRGAGQRRQRAGGRAAGCPAAGQRRALKPARKAVRCRPMRRCSRS